MILLWDAERLNKEESKGGSHARPRALKHVEENKESKRNKKVWSER